MQVRGLTSSEIEALKLENMMRPDTSHPDANAGSPVPFEPSRAQRRQLMKIGKRAPAAMTIPKGRRRRSR